MRTPAARRDQAGLTAIELVVAAAIGSIVLAGVATVMVATSRLSNNTLTRTANSRAVRSAAEVVTTSLRVGTRPTGEIAAVVDARPNEVTFYALLNRSGVAATADVAPTRVRYWWDSTTKCLTQTRVVGVAISPTPATGPQWSWTAAAQNRCVAKTTAAPVFTYYASSAISVNGVPIADLGATAAGLPAATLPSVKSVQAQLTVQDPANPTVNGSSILDRVTLNNV
ncbi:MAG: prepilin-type N-terminal cleavage/methylation domain-containing protein [Kineosporiaceae bacterium]|jgi:type II secretory pathway component PulJ